MRRLASLCRLLMIVAGVATPALGVASSPAPCGFVPDDRVKLASDGVSVILVAEPLPDERRRQWLARRARLLRRGAQRPDRCEKTHRYVQSILDRLTRVEGLEPLRRLDPPLELVLQCNDDVPLPVARALAGNVLLVPRALPLLAASEDALAAVLAHEVAHVSLQHVQRFQRYGAAAPRAAARDIVLAHESEADIAGLRILARAGYDPGAAIDHLQAVSVMHKARASRPAPPRRHAEDGVRAARLKAQIGACGYGFSGQRTPIPSEIVDELAIALELPAPVVP